MCVYVCVCVCVCVKERDVCKGQSGRQTHRERDIVCVCEYEREEVYGCGVKNRYCGSVFESVREKEVCVSEMRKSEAVREISRERER